MKFAIQNLLILICLVAGNCPAIGQYGFLKIYGINDTKSLNFDDLIWNKDGVVVRGNIYIDSLNRWGLFLCLIDTSGSIVWQHIYPDSKGIDDVISNTPTRFTTTTDKGFLLPVSYFERGNTGVYKTDSIGNLEFTAEYINSEKTMIPNNIVISSGNYFISGIHQRNDYNVDIFVQKIDSTGILKWLKYYGGNELNEFGEIIIDNLGRFQIGGQIFPLHYSELPFEDRWRKPWIFSIDSCGSIMDEWIGDMEDGKAKGSFGLIQTKTGDWAMKYVELEKEGPITVYTKPAISLLDSNFNLIWKQQIGDFNSPENAFFDLLYDSIKNNLIVVGQIGFDEKLQGVIVKYSMEGEEIWKVITSSPINGRHYLAGVCISPSGSIFTAGRIEQDQPSRDYGWILKVTPDGCIDTLCTTSSILDQVYQKENVVVYPNPLTDILIIDWKNQPPFHSILYCYDSTGSVRAGYEITDNHQTFDLSDLPPGPLFYKIQSGNLVLKSGMLVKI